MEWLVCMLSCKVVGLGSNPGSQQSRVAIFMVLSFTCAILHLPVYLISFLTHPMHLFHSLHLLFLPLTFSNYPSV